MKSIGQVKIAFLSHANYHRSEFILKKLRTKFTLKNMKE